MNLKILMVKKSLESEAKCLISKCFEDAPENLWITLLKTCHEPPETLKNQGFQQIAHPVGILNFINKINNLRIYGLLRKRP
jgi:hypothetical protein